MKEAINNSPVGVVIKILGFACPGCNHRVTTELMSKIVDRALLCPVCGKYPLKDYRQIAEVLLNQNEIPRGI